MYTVPEDLQLLLREAKLLEMETEAVLSGRPEK